MQIDQCQTVRKLLGRLPGVELREKKGAKLKFRVYVTQKMYDTPLEEMEFSVRAFHSLKRAGFDTVGDMMDAIDDGVELKNIRNCGATSIREIMEKMFLFQYYSLPEGKREAYLEEVVEINKGRV
ncbi:MAG: hypothetical protein K6A90_06350 [Lachnospiraceae bacterium]|nr:hypothetical protein [Lachnospiraceae bacterium]